MHRVGELVGETPEILGKRKRWFLDAIYMLNNCPEVLPDHDIGRIMPPWMGHFHGINDETCM